MIIDPSQQIYKENYKIMTGTILPRPIALVSTLSADGTPNLAPFSFFTGISSNPPIVCFAPTRKGDGTVLKDTLNNINATGEFVINMVTEEMAEAMNECGTDFPPEVNEFEVAGFTPLKSERVAPFRVEQSPIHYECKLVQVIPVGKEEAGGGFLVLGEVVLFHIADHLIDDRNRIDPKKVKPLARLGGPFYAGITDLISIKRK